MNCKDCHKKLIFFLEGDLPAEEGKYISEHLSACRSCAGFAEYLKGSLDVIPTEKHPEPSSYMYTRIKAKLQKADSGESVKSWMHVLQPAFFSVMLAAAIYTGIKLGQEFSENIIQPGYTEEMSAIMNEIRSEPLEMFLMD